MHIVAAVVVWLLGVATLGSHAAAGATVESVPVYDRIIGSETTHVVASGETLGHIAAGFGIKTTLAATLNHLTDVNRLHLGQRVRLSNRHIVPTSLRDGIVINVGELMLYWLHDGTPVAALPVGVGRAAWETPAGHYTIVSRRRDPVWHVPRSIQHEMQKAGAPVKKKVAPGPENPLGKYWLQLSVPGYGIHGTNAPRSVGKYTTHGCIRLRPDDIERLYKEVPNGSAVDIVDEPIKLARVDDGTILLEAHPGVAGRVSASGSKFLERLKVSEIADLIDFGAAQRVLADTWGIAVDVSKQRVPSTIAH